MDIALARSAERTRRNPPCDNPKGKSTPAASAASRMDWLSLHANVVLLPASATRYSVAELSFGSSGRFGSDWAVPDETPKVSLIYILRGDSGCHEALPHALYHRPRAADQKDTFARIRGIFGRRRGVTTLQNAFGGKRVP